MTQALVAVIAVLTATLLWLWLRLRAIAEARGSSAEAALSRAAALEREKARTEELLERMEEGVLVLSEVLLPVLANRAARSMLGVKGAALPPRLTSEGILSVARRALVENAVADDAVSTWPARRRLRVRATPLQERGGVIVVLQDVTDEDRTHQIRRQFVANASHELKSPVASLHALAEATNKAVHDDPRAAQRFSERLIVEAERLGRLIGDLLDLSKLEDPSNISATPLDLSTVTRQVLDEIPGEATEKNVIITAHISAAAWLRGDKAQLSLLVRNLLDNAIRYTPDGGSVRIDVFPEGGEIVLRVADDGIGIPLQAQARVFERFYRVDKDRSRERGGTGLGLSIVKHVVELHGGHIGLQSELGEGSTFTVRMPALPGSSNGAKESLVPNRESAR
jgi:two-component system phosphate regulon sensor histidine kinase PhoR